MLPLVVGNWKMNGTQRQARALARAVTRGANDIQNVEIALAPPFTALPALAKSMQASPIGLAAQNIHWQDSGAFTGEISGPMVAELGCRYVIIGHSERRHIFQETDENVAQKMLACLRIGLRPILCVGETAPERTRGATRQVIARQLRASLKALRKTAIGNFDIAYEPVWAIGTGNNATPEQVGAVHGWIQKSFAKFLGARGKKIRSRVLYGGSVRPENSQSLAILPEVDGFLVGGASLDAQSFLRIVRAFS